MEAVHSNTPFETPVSPILAPKVNLLMPPSPSPPVRLRPARPAITSKYLASGTEGCIIGPALPNISENGSKWEEYPDNVTKLYKNINMYEKAQENSKKIVNLLRNNSHRVYPYRHNTYMGISTSKSVQKSCDLPPYDPLIPLRMKNLGVSIGDLSRNINNSLVKTKLIPFGTILDNIYKVYKQVELLFNNGYIHGDVRQTNIMIQPNTGKITLIDFGWLYPIDKFFYEYSYALGFYSNPPESLLNVKMIKGSTKIVDKYIHYILKPKTTEEDINKKIQSEFLDDKNTIINEILDAYLYNSEITENRIEEAEIQEALINNALYFKKNITVKSPRDYNNEFQQYYRLMAPSFDLYGLSFTINILLKHVYSNLDSITKNGVPYTEKEENLIKTSIEKLIQDVIKPGMELDISKRINISEAYERLGLIMTSYHDNYNSMKGGRRRKTQKRRSIKRKKTLRRK